MKKILFATTLLINALCAFSQTPTSIYEAPITGNKFNRFEHDDASLYAVRDSSVDIINATTNAVSKLFDKPWGASINANGKAIFSNGKSIIGQYIPGSPYRYKYWVYNGSTFDTLFSLVNTQIDNWVIDGNSCYFYIGANKKVYKSDFTKAGTVEIANMASNTLVVSMIMFNHDLYFFNTTSATNNNVLKKYSSNVLTTIDSSSNYSFDDFKMTVYNNNFYYSHYQFKLSPTARYSSKVINVNSSGSVTTLYADTTSTAIYVKGFMGGLGANLLIDASIGATSNENVFKLNAVSSGTPVILQNNLGSNLKPQSAPTFVQGNSIIYIDAYDPANLTSGNRDLWQTDGTTIGTKMVTAPTATNIVHASGFSLGNVDQWCLQGVTCGNTLYSILNYTELWSEDGLTFPSKINVPGYMTFGSLANCAGNVFMTAQSSTTYKPQIMKLTCASSTGFIDQKITSVNFIVYPNPAKETLNIKVNQFNNEPTLVKLTNLLGEVISSSVVLENEIITLNTSHLNSGIYFVTIENKGFKGTQKIVIE